ncbi:MAG: hypothetical protein ACAH17_00380 [Candidatus Paceibacterota bacterium]
MKRLGVYAFIALFLLLSGSVVVVQKVQAQTVEQILQHTSPIIDEKITALNNEMSLFGSTHGNRNSVEYKEYAETNAAEVTMVRRARTIFENTLTAQSSRTPSQLYGDALLAASQSLADQSAANPILQRAQAVNFINAFRNELITEASTQERIRAINTGQALSDEAQQNATASKVAANPGSKPPVGLCKWNNFTISACIDEAFTWFIKNTFLQVAGFLVWLCANMLNFSIQVSILNFAQWAPSTLYPIYVVIRQIVSLVVVFAGLYLGFMYIIGREDTFAKYVGWLCIYAIFVNFSYPVTRALTDVSNVISLNVYSAAVGVAPLETDFASAATTLGGNTAGALIMNRLGLNGLVGSATNVAGEQAGFLGSITSTPGALVTLAFVLYAAYIFFMATAIIATRTAVLVFLIVASPLLLIDSVVPKLGEVAMKMRKMLFEQLTVAPVFMIMLALTLKFMEVFQSGPLAGATTGALNGGADSIKTFFGILMMLIMLHIMLKVTKSVAGEAGNYATNFMGKVGGFGLGVASGGAGLLARGSIGAAASRMQNSAWMDKLQGSRTGRGLYNLTNSLAQSTFDTRNIGMVSKGMASAGITGMGGVGMQSGLKKGYTENFTDRQKNFNTKFSSIKDGDARAGFVDQTKNSVFSKTGRTFLGKSDGDIMTKKATDTRINTANMYNTIQDPAKKLAYYQEHKSDIDAWKEDQEREAKAVTSTTANPAVAKTGTEAGEGNIDIPAFQRNIIGSKAQTSGATSVAEKVTEAPYAKQMGPTDIQKTKDAFNNFSFAEKMRRGGDEASPETSAPAPAPKTPSPQEATATA